MNFKERLDCLQGDVDKLVQRYGAEATRHKKSAVFLKLVSVLVAATITILLGLKVQSTELKETFANIALVLGAIITVLSAYEAFFDPRALWIRETVTFARMKDVQRDLRYWAAGVDPGGIDDAMLALFKRRVDRVLEDSLKYWMKVRGATDLESAAGAAKPSRRERPEAEKPDKA